MNDRPDLSTYWRLRLKPWFTGRYDGRLPPVLRFLGPGTYLASDGKLFTISRRQEKTI